MVEDVVVLDEVGAEVEVDDVVVLVSVRFDEYFRVMLVTFTRRYFRMELLGGGSAR